MKETYIIPSDNEKAIVISWVGNWKSTIVEYDEKNIGTFTSIKELKQGREFILNDKEKVFVKLNGVLHPKLEMSYNGNKISSSSKMPKNLFKQAYNLSFLIGILNVVAGIAPLILNNESYDRGHLTVLIFGGLTILLAFRVKKKSRVSLLLICILISIDIISSLYQIQFNGEYIAIATVKAIILYSLIDGYKALKEIK